MVFNSFEFAVFFLAVYVLYLLLQRHLVWQNRLLLAASLIFYGWWDGRFLLLMLVTIFTDFFAAKAIAGSEDPARRRLFLGISIAVNLGILGFFKYFNFFAESLESLLRTAGIPATHPALSIVLPVGISFYTFQSMSYTLDVYRRQLVPARHLPDFALFVTFFPQLVAGPIERATHLLGQVLNPRKLSLAAFYEGCYLIGWGLFKKIFIADNMALFVSPVFQAPGPYNGYSVLAALYAFALQIYCDFSGYSDIARGLGKCMGFDIMLNFNLPYFSTSPREFWQRWHISFSTWLRDYLYIPLGGSRKGGRRTLINLMLTMLLGGLWHGARWNFVIWGAYHGLLLILYQILDRRKEQPESGLMHGLRVIFFFHLICLGWLFFRAGAFQQIESMVQGLIFNFSFPDLKIFMTDAARFIFYGGILFVVQFFQRASRNLMAVYESPVWVRTAFYLVCFYLFVIYGATGGQEFIYFQF